MARMPGAHPRPVGYSQCDNRHTHIYIYTYASQASTQAPQPGKVSEPLQQLSHSARLPSGALPSLPLAFRLLAVQIHTHAAPPWPCQDAALPHIPGFECVYLVLIYICPLNAYSIQHKAERRYLITIQDLPNECISRASPFRF